MNFIQSLRPPGGGILNSGVLSPPPPGTTSVSSAVGRLNLGKTGLYKKAEYVILFTNAPGGDPRGITVNNQVIVNYQFGVKCPSSRIRAAMGVSGHRYGATINDFNSLGSSSFLNVIPGIRMAGAAQGDNTSDNEIYMWGAPVFDWTTVTRAGNMTYIDPRDNAADGKLLPYTYEATSAADYYQVKGQIVTGATLSEKVLLPIYGFASWEIIDPRNGEDTEALLSQCALVAGSPKALTANG